MLDIKLHVQGIVGSGRIKEGERPSALFGGLLEIDGKIIDQMIQVEIIAREGFLEVKPILSPGTFEVVTHTDESWPELLKRIDAQEKLRNMNGLAIARTPEDD